MPNHIHWIFTLPEENDNVIKIITSFKSYTATQILKKLKSSGEYDIEPVDTIFDNNLNIKGTISSSLLKIFYNPNPAKRSTYTFWQKDSDLKAVCKRKFFFGKNWNIYMLIRHRNSGLLLILRKYIRSAAADIMSVVMIGMGLIFYLYYRPQV